MFDDHTFRKLTGTLDEILDGVRKAQSEDHWGMLCPVIVLCGNKELRRVGPFVHGGGSKGKDVFEDGLMEWKQEILQDADVRRLISNGKTN